MVSTLDQRVVWVSDSFADCVGLPTNELTGGSIFDLLDSADEPWVELFTGTDRVDEQFHGFGVHLVDSESHVQFELNGVRYVDRGRTVMVSLRWAASKAEWESEDAFVTDMRAAMVSGAIYVAYQPIVDINDGELTKLEALARWMHPDRGAIGPTYSLPGLRGPESSTSSANGSSTAPAARS